MKKRIVVYLTDSNHSNELVRFDRCSMRVARLLASIEKDAVIVERRALIAKSALA